VLNRVKSVEIVSAHFEHTVPNILAGSKLSFIANTVPSELIFEEGFYSADDIVEIVQNYFDATIQAEATFSLSERAPYKFQLDIVDSVITSVESTPLWNQLGFDHQSAIGLMPNTLITAANLPRLQGTPEVYIHCREIATPAGDADSPDSLNYICCVPLQIEYGKTVHIDYLPKQFTHRYPRRRSLTDSSLNFRVRDRFGNLVNLDPNSDWSILLRVEYELI